MADPSVDLHAIRPAVDTRPLLRLGQTRPSPSRLGSLPVAKPEAAPPSSPALPPLVVATRWRPVPAGPFHMGADDLSEYERPQRLETSVRFDFEMMETEVSVKLYSACVTEGRCSPPMTEGSCARAELQKLDHPVVCVTYPQAAQFCRALGQGARLPSEEEWERAARGADGRSYPWGAENPDGRACFDQGEVTCPVGRYPQGRSPFGILDLAGNVWEWTNSTYCHARLTPKCAAHSNLVIRGGAATSLKAIYLRAAYRGSAAANVGQPNLGFRCVRPLGQAAP